MDELLSVPKAAELAGVDRRTIHRWFRDELIGGELVPFGSREMMRVSRASLEKYLAERADQG